MKFSLFIIFFLIVSSCSRVATLNQKRHQFGKKAKYLVWMQIAGLSEEQLALFKFNKSDNVETLSFENAKCSGDLWAFNAFELRPSSKNGFTSQLTGSKNITGQCGDIEQNPLWTYLDKVGFRNLLIESPGTGKNSLATYNNCPKANEFFSNLQFFRMENSSDLKDAKFFHYQESLPSENGQYFDKTCKDGTCYVSLVSNIKSIWDKTLKQSKDPFSLIIRDFNYAEKVKQGRILEAREIFIELEKLHSFFQKEAKEKGLKLTLLVSTSGVKQWEFPKEGKEWARFEKNGRFTTFRNQSLVSSVWASGPGSENFCGIFEESEMLRRILWRDEGQVFSLENFKSFFQ